MADSKISALTDGGALQSADEFVVERSGADYKIAGSALGPTSTATTTTMGVASSGATTVTITNQPSWVRTGQRIVIDPYTSVCESRRITAVSGTTVTLDVALSNNHSGTTLVLCPVNGVFNVEWFGAKGDASTTGQEVPINAAATAAQAAIGGSNRGGTVYVPRGIYICSDQVQIPQGVSLVGDPSSAYGGELASQLWPGTDFGAGKYLVICTTRNDGRNLFRDIAVYGSISSWTAGVAPRNMRGLGIGSGSIVDNVWIEGFYGGLCIVGNHSIFERSRFMNSYYNIYFEDDQTGTYGFGNHRFRGIQMSTAALAACGVGGASVIDFATWEDIDCGHAPFCFYKETYINQPFMNQVFFRNLNAEQWKNGIFWDSNTGNVSHFTKVTIAGPGGISSPATALTGYDVRLLNLDYVSGFDVSGDFLLPNPGGNYSGLTDTLVTAHRFANVRIRNESSIFAAAKSSGKKFSAGGSMLITWESGDSSASGFVLTSVSAVTAGQLVQAVNNATCDIYSSGAPLGFAYAAGDATSGFPVQTSGYVPSAPCTGTVSAGDYLKPSATAGSVQKATGITDGPIVGIATSGGTDTTISLEIRL